MEKKNCACQRKSLLKFKHFRLSVFFWSFNWNLRWRKSYVCWTFVNVKTRLSKRSREILHVFKLLQIESY